MFSYKLFLSFLTLQLLKSVLKYRSSTLMSFRDFCKTYPTHMKKNFGYYWSFLGLHFHKWSIQISKNINFQKNYIIGFYLFVKFMTIELCYEMPFPPIFISFYTKIGKHKQMKIPTHTTHPNLGWLLCYTWIF